MSKKITLVNLGYILIILTKKVFYEFLEKNEPQFEQKMEKSFKRSTK